MPTRRLPAAAFVAVAALAFAASASPASAGLAAETFRGSHCHPSHFDGETEDWVYEGPDLANRGASAWDVLIANCPVHTAPPQPVASSRILEIRVVVDGANFSNGWCTLTDWQGIERNMNRSTTNPEWFWWTPPTNSGYLARDFTVECLVLQNWQLERVEVIWTW